MICCAAVTSGPMPGENKHPRARKMRMCHGCEKQFIPTGPWKCSCRLAHYCGTGFARSLFVLPGCSGWCETQFWRSQLAAVTYSFHCHLFSFYFIRYA